MSQDNEIKVFISNRENICLECENTLGAKAWITLNNKEVCCLVCSDLDHLVYLPSGNAALTRRSKKNSKMYAVVLQWSGARKRYERQGLLVEKEALENAEKECLSDHEIREKRNERRREAELVLDKEYIKIFASELHKIFPNCPSDTAEKISNHACQKYSGRVGRTAMAKNFDPGVLTLAAIAHIRHVETNYDSLLMEDWDRREAREKVRTDIDAILNFWRR
jgi:hypothetical protein